MKNSDSPEILDDLHDRVEKKMEQPLGRLFLSAQVAAILGTAVDFIMVYILTEWAGLWYIISNIIGASLGAITNFLLGRYWVFSSTQRKIYTQAFRYFIVALGSLILNTSGLYLMTEFLGFHYILSKVIVAVLIAVTFNFFMQKNYVYR